MIRKNRSEQNQKTLDNGVQKWIAEGHELARREAEASFETIEIQHTAEAAAFGVLRKNIEVTGSALVVRRTELLSELRDMNFNQAAHLAQLAQGKTELYWAIGLSVLNGALALFVLLAFGPVWLASMLSLLVLASALPVEEFFHALDERATLREGIFLTLSTLALSAQFWLGTARGLFLAALTLADVGPTGHILGTASTILQYTLGVFSLASEVLCGYKLSCARKHLLSPTVSGVRERDRHTRKLGHLYNALEAAKIEPEIRRAYRMIGARQYLALAAAGKRQYAENHLKRALKGALIALAMLALLLFLATHLSAAPLRGRRIVPVVDLSKSVSPENFRSNLAAVGNILSVLRPGDRAVIIGVTDSFGRPTILFDQTMPLLGGYLSFQTQAARETIMEQWTKTATRLKPTYAHTDMVGALSTLPYLSGIVGSETDIFVLGDLQNSTRELDLEHRETIPVGRLIDRLKRTNAVPNLTDCNVFLLGVDPVGKSAEYFGSLRQFWLAFFREAHANVRAFSIDRHIPSF